MAYGKARIDQIQSSTKTVNVDDLLTNAAGSVTSTQIEDGTIVNADINAAAAIAKTKIAGTAITAADTGTVTSAMLANGAIVNDDINANAEIAVSKLADGAARQLLQTDAAGTGVEWTDNIDVPGTLDVTGAATFDGAVTVQGDLTVNGTTTTIDTQNLLVEDKNIIVGNVDTPTDTTADGGGITLKGATDKTITWSDTTNAWTSSETLDAPAGTASLPSVIFNGDVNSGIYSPGADQVAISTGGTGRLFVDASGRLGLGNSTPGSYNGAADDLVVGNHTGAHGVTICSQNNSSGYIMFADGTTGPEAYSGQITYDHTNNRLTFGTTDGTTGLTIDSSQRVGIGNNAPGAILDVSPDANRNLQVQGKSGTSYGLELKNGSANSGGEFHITAASSGGVVFNRGTTEMGRFDNNSRLLVGTSSTDTSYYGAATYTPHFQFKGSTASSSSMSLTRTDGSGPVMWFQAGASGQVPGIDTFVGGFAFSGYDGAGYRNAARIEAFTDAATGSGDMPGRLVFSTTADAASSPTERMRIDSSGRVGIGTTSPTHQLTVHNASTTSGTVEANRFSVRDNYGSATGLGNGFISPSSNNLAIVTNSTERMRLDSSGRLGLGTSSPTTRFHVDFGDAADNSIRLVGDGATNGAAIATSWFTGTSYFDVRLGGNTTSETKLRVTSAGNVGIGTSTINAKLQIEGTDAAPAASGNMNSGIVYQVGSGTRAINIGVDNTNQFAWINSAYTNNSGTATDTGLRLMVGATSAITIDSSRRVGIGTTAPAARLEVQDGSISIGSSVNSSTTNTLIAGYGYILSGTKYGNTSIRSTYTNSTNAASLEFYVASSGTATDERMRLDSSGRLLVGTSSVITNGWGGTGGLFQVAKNDFLPIGLFTYSSTAADGYCPYFELHRARGSQASPTIVSSGDELGEINFYGHDGSTFTRGASIRSYVDGTPGANDMPGRLVFSTTADGAASPTERMRISQGGRVLIGTTTDPGYQLSVVGANSYAFGVRQDVGNSTYPVATFHSNFTSGDNKLVDFYTDASSNRGSITYNRGGGVIAYNTTSDYRSKTLLGDVENPGQTIDALKVYRGVMNGATVERPMLVAHEAQVVAPYCVTGEKDAVDDDGNPIYQQMDHQVLVPLLIAEIQQLRARVAALEAS